MRDIQAVRRETLDERLINRKRGSKMCQETEDECNKSLRALNCEIQGIENPDDVVEEPTVEEDEIPLTQWQKAAATRKKNSEKKDVLA
jgi:hypothetical protein